MSLTLRGCLNNALVMYSFCSTLGFICLRWFMAAVQKPTVETALILSMKYLSLNVFRSRKKWMNSFYSLYFRLKLLWSRYLPTWYLAQHAWSPAEWAVVEVGAVAQREERAHRRHAQRTQQPAQDLRRIGAIQQTQYLIWNVSEISLKTLTNLPLLAT